MPFQPPAGPYRPEYRISFRDVLTDGDEFHVQFSVVADTTEITTATAEAVVQKFVDLVASSPDFTAVDAQRTTEYREEITPS